MMSFFAAQPPIPAVGAQHLEHADVAPTHRGGQPGAGGAGALDREGQLLAQADGPIDQLRVAGPVGGEAPGVEHSAELIEGDRDMHVLVDVHADDHPMTPLDDLGNGDHARHCCRQQTRPTVAVLAGRVDGTVTRLSAIRLL
jgi:hypothetical protein